LKAALIVDDDLTILRNFSRLLRENGYEVVAVTTGEGAIEEASKRRFDLVLLDNVLLTINGLSALEAMGDNVKDAVKIMITGFPLLEDTVKAFDLGIDAYIIKPVKAQDLLALIEQKTIEKQH
jgi:DNA-binding response OmpR family regulator